MSCSLYLSGPYLPLSCHLIRACWYSCVCIWFVIPTSQKVPEDITMPSPLSALPAIPEALLDSQGLSGPQGLCVRWHNVGRDFHKALEKAGSHAEAGRDLRLQRVTRICLRVEVGMAEETTE